MAGVGAAESILESELSCPVCLTIYRDPVSLGCGHCFCKQCITDALCHQRDQGRTYTCPICQALYEDFPTFLKNFQLANIVENFLSMQNSSRDPQIICGDCLDHPNPAVKTCVICEVSLCQKHVERHIQRKHTLLEPTASVQERKCPQHDKLLEYNCEQDNSCICVTCYIAGPHKGHNIVTLKEAHEKHLTTLSQTVSSLSSSISAFNKDIEDLKAGLAKMEKNTVQLCKPLEDLRDRILLLVNEQFLKITQDIAVNQDEAISEMTAIKKQMEDAKASAEQALEELNLISKQPDDLLFVQKFNRSLLISQQSLKINTMQVVNVQADKVLMENIEEETSDYIVEIGKQLNGMHNVLSQQTVKLVWSGKERNEVQNQNKVPSIKSKKLEKLDLMFQSVIYTHCSYSVTVSNQNKTITTTESNSTSYAGPSFGRPAHFHFGGHNFSSHSNTPYCNCQLPVVIPDSIAGSPPSGKVYCLVNVSTSDHWCVGVIDATLGVNAYLQWKQNCLSYESGTSLSLGMAKINTLKMQLDFDTKLLGFYDASNEPETLILICKCELIFAGSINIGFNILQGSLSLI